MDLSGLPLQLLPHICRHLPVAEAAALARCCRAFRRIVQNTRACRCGYHSVDVDSPYWVPMGPGAGGALAWMPTGRVGIVLIGDQPFLDFWPVLCAERRPGEFLRLHLRVERCSCLTREHLALLGAVCHSLVVDCSRGVRFTGLEALKNLEVVARGVNSHRPSRSHAPRACASWS